MHYGLDSSTHGQPLSMERPWASSDLDDGDDATMHRLRERVLTAVVVGSAVGASLVTGILMVQAAERGPLPPTLIVLAAIVCTLWLVVFTLGRLMARTTAVLLLLHILLGSTYLHAFHGLTPSSTLTDVAFLLVAAMFFGTRGLALGSLALLLSLGASGLVALKQWVAPWDDAFWDPTQGLVWLRYLLMLLFMVGTVAVAIAALIDGLVERHDQLQSALERERYAREQRERAQRALERARRVESMSQLAAGLAHDFNNSLTAIMMLAHRIETSEEASPAIAELARDIGATVESSGSTVNDLLNAGRHDRPLVQTVEVRPMLTRLQSVLRAIFPSTVEVTVAIDGVERVRADSARLQQSLLNLALNARDAMPAGGSFTISVTRDERLGSSPGARTPVRYVVFTCADSGTGMSEGVQDRLFEPFFTTKSGSGGTGLGLPMVRSALMEIGGFVEVESTPGRGTTFRLYVPDVDE